MSDDAQAPKAPENAAPDRWAPPEPGAPADATAQGAQSADAVPVSRVDPGKGGEDARPEPNPWAPSADTAPQPGGGISPQDTVLSADSVPAVPQDDTGRHADSAAAGPQDTLVSGDGISSAPQGAAPLWQNPFAPPAADAPNAPFAAPGVAQAASPPASPASSSNPFAPPMPPQADTPPPAAANPFAAPGSPGAFGSSDNPFAPPAPPASFAQPAPGEPVPPPPIGPDGAGQVPYGYPQYPAPGYPQYPGPGYPGSGHPAPGYPAGPGYGSPYGPHMGAPGYGWPGMPLPPSNGMGTAALVLGIISAVVFCLWPIAIVIGVLSVVFGVIGRRRARRGEATNSGQALAGIICGAVGIVLAVAFMVIIFAAPESSSDPWSTTDDSYSTSLVVNADR
ncbi:DUF4190 domain-containing protein [Streptomyces avermitilis]|uniref:DUF4190 domain-containing protein n=1 Tax=Streptomyces avermitilis TaxID=33903 RepID=UPI0033DEE413